jgi:hypothetical protein
MTGFCLNEPPFLPIGIVQLAKGKASRIQKLRLLQDRRYHRADRVLRPSITLIRTPIH